MSPRQHRRRGTAAAALAAALSLVLLLAVDQLTSSPRCSMQNDAAATLRSAGPACVRGGPATAWLPGWMG
jgi:hypothetical protein